MGDQVKFLTVCLVRYIYVTSATISVMLHNKGNVTLYGKVLNYLIKVTLTSQVMIPNMVRLVTSHKSVTLKIRQ